MRLVRDARITIPYDGVKNSITKLEIKQNEMLQDDKDDIKG